MMPSEQARFNSIQFKGVIFCDANNRIVKVDDYLNFDSTLQ